MTTPSFRIGFTGSTLDEVLPWLGEQVGDTTKLVVAMAGSGKDIAYLAREDRMIYSWDPQILSRVVVDGIFAAPAAVPVPIERGELFGYASTEGAISGMPYGAAALVDWIASQGTDYDRACLAKALIRSTYMGRLKVWARDSTEDTLWAAYLAAHAKFASWRGRPGTFHHVQGSVFADPDLEAKMVGATLLIDTPKVLHGGKRGDIYSTGFEGLNSILAQSPQVLPPWTRDTFERDIPVLLRAPWSRMIFFHATGCRPTVGEVTSMVLYGTGDSVLSDFAEWTHKGRTDVAWVADRAGAHLRPQGAPGGPQPLGAAPATDEVEVIPVAKGQEPLW